jgi:hypothetical protein
MPGNGVDPLSMFMTTAPPPLEPVEAGLGDANNLVEVVIG